MSWVYSTDVKKCITKHPRLVDPALTLDLKHSRQKMYLYSKTYHKFRTTYHHDVLKEVEFFTIRSVFLVQEFLAVCFDIRPINTICKIMGYIWISEELWQLHFPFYPTSKYQIGKAKKFCAMEWNRFISGGIVESRSRVKLLC